MSGSIMLGRRMSFLRNAPIRRRSLACFFGAICGLILPLGFDAPGLGDKVSGHRTLADVGAFDLRWNLTKVDDNRTVLPEQKNGDSVPFIAVELGIKDKLAYVSSCDPSVVFGVDVKQIPASDSRDFDDEVTITEKTSELRSLEFAIGERYHEKYDFLFFAPCNSYISDRRLQEIVAKAGAGSAIHLGNAHEGVCSGGLLMGSAVLQNADQLVEKCEEADITQMSDCMRRILGVPCVPEFKNVRFFAMDATEEPLDRIVEAFRSGKDSPAVVNGVSSAKDALQLFLADYEGQANELRQEVASKRWRLLATLGDGPSVGIGLPDRPDAPVDELLRSANGFPPEFPPPRKLKNRFDVIPWTFGDSRGVVYVDGERSVSRRISDDERAELTDIIEQVERLTGDACKLHGAYWRLDYSRGLEFLVDVTDSAGTMRRFEAIRPLGSAEIVPVEFVTEKTNVFVAIAVDDSNLESVMSSVDSWIPTVSAQGSKLRLLLGSPPSLLLSEQFGNCSACYRVDVTGRGAFALADAAVKIVPEDAIFFLLESPVLEMRKEFLNRIRLQVIKGVQVFVPFPFVHFHPEVAKEGGKRHFSVNSGKFDRYRSGFVGFYPQDYAKARRRMELANEGDRAMAVVDMFHRHSDLHVMLAPDRGLVMGHDSEEERVLRRVGVRALCAEKFAEEASVERCVQSRSVNLGTKQLLGKALLKRRWTP